MKPFSDPEVAAAFSAYPPAIRRRMLELRRLIFATAAKTEGVGTLEESLRWGEPAYLTRETKSGSTIRIDWKEKRPAELAMYFHCQANLVGRFRRMFGKKLRFEGNRAVVFGESEPIPVKELGRCIELALTYHQKPKRK